MRIGPGGPAHGIRERNPFARPAFRAGHAGRGGRGHPRPREPRGVRRGPRAPRAAGPVPPGRRPYRPRRRRGGRRGRRRVAGAGAGREVRLVGTTGSLDRPTWWQRTNLPGIARAYEERVGTIDRLLEGRGFRVLLTHYPPAHATRGGGKEAGR